MTARYVDVHVLQTVPYSNLNRDDLGSPKTVFYGGVERTRISSQCWKRATRLAMQDHLGQQAIRTRRLQREVATALSERGWAGDIAAFAGEQVAAAAGLKGLGSKKDLTVLLFLPATAVEELAGICQTHEEQLRAAFAKSVGRKSAESAGKKAAEPALPRDQVTAVVSGRNGIIDLFGRMLAELPGANVDGAVQVAHAFTTHGTTPQVDFFTAVDDLNPGEDTGSGHMDSNEFAAGTFYRYASINLRDLLENVGDDAGLAGALVDGFLTAFLTAMPQAKKNSTAPFTIPDLGYVAVRADRPVSLAGAFEAPVRAPYEGGHAEPSRLALEDHASRIDRLLGTEGRLHHAYAAADDKELAALGQRVTSFRDLVAGAVAGAGLR
jgi:CRISPR system Cascade subunit CasC